jgi:gentisate 1,2-dioxygenase
MHRIRSGASTLSRREVGSSVYQVFEGSGKVKVGDHTWTVKRGDMFVVPSWQPFSAHCDETCPGSLDLFRFSDAPILEALHSHRTASAELE